MKYSRRLSRKLGDPAVLTANPVGQFIDRAWLAFSGVAAAAVMAAIVYGPTLHGPFVFDDLHLPFFRPEWSQWTFLTWLRCPRPLLLATFWAEFRVSGLDPYSYHLVNVLLHLANSGLLFPIARRLFQTAGIEGKRLEILAAFTAGLFLLHPVQTEAVTYISSRSETMSLTFIYLAILVFLYRRTSAIPWQTAAAILLLFALAECTKEQAIGLLPALLVTDYFWNPGFSWAGIRRNWRLYVTACAAGAVALVYVLRILATAKSAGFGLSDVRWNEYLFTQFRIIWHYLRLFVLPYGQSIDPDAPLSQNLFDRGAIVGLAGLVVVTAAAFRWRRRIPLASYGWFTFLILLAPTSSFVPLADACAEHRLYLPMFGLLLMAAEGLRRLKISDRALAGLLAFVLLGFSAAAQARNQVWTRTTTLWEDAVSKAPHKPRPHFQLAYAYQKLGRCADALREYRAAWQAGDHGGPLLADWGLAYDCNHQPDKAISKLREAAATSMEPYYIAHIWSLIGRVYDEHGHTRRALEALSTGEAIEPRCENLYLVRGTVLAHDNRFLEAASEFRKLLLLNPHNREAQSAVEIMDQLSQVHSARP